MSRPDPALMYLKDLGYLPVRLPRTDVVPLQLVARSGKDLDPLGHLADVMMPGSIPLPAVLNDIQAAGGISGQRSARIKLSIGLTILGNIVQALTGKDLDFSAAYGRARTLRFEFTGVSVAKIDVVRLDQFLNRAGINPDCKHVEEMMIDDEVGVITATVSSRKFLVSAQDEADADVEVNVPVVQAVAGGNLKVEAAGAHQFGVSYEGVAPVIFGVQAVRLFFDENGHYTAFDPFKAGEGAVRAFGLAAASTPTLFTVDGAFTRIRSPRAHTAANR